MKTSSHLLLLCFDGLQPEPAPLLAPAAVPAPLVRRVPHRDGDALVLGRGQGQVQVPVERRGEVSLA